MVFEDFTDDELLTILNNYLTKKGLRATVPALLMAMDVLAKKRRLPNFGNAGEVHNVVNAAITKYTSRTRENPKAARELQPDDFLNDEAQQVESIEDIFRPMLGCDLILKRLRTMHTLIQRKKNKGMDFISSLNLNFVFVGKPGTGKTSVATLMGRVFKSLDILASSEVVSVSAAKLQAPYVGQTAALVRETFKSALGKVLFIDEAYRLDPHQSPGSFMKEAMDEMVSILTEDEFKGKLVVVLAGYTREMHQMLHANQGLASRFPDEIPFPTFTMDDSFKLLHTVLTSKQYALAPDALNDPCVRKAMSQIVAMPSFASGRDIHSIVGKIEINMASLPDEAPVVNDGTSSDDFSVDPSMTVTTDLLEQTLRNFLQGSHARAKDAHDGSSFRNMFRGGNSKQHRSSHSFDDMTDLTNESPFQVMHEHASAPKMDIIIEQQVERCVVIDDSTESDDGSDDSCSSHSGDGQRDPGVSDAVWKQLQINIRDAGTRDAAEKSERDRLDARLGQLEDQFNQLNSVGRTGDAQQVAVQINQVRDKLRKIRDGKRKAVDIQKKLSQMGLCVAGFQWIQQPGGYRCAGQ